MAARFLVRVCAAGERERNRVDREVRLLTLRVQKQIGHPPLALEQGVLPALSGLQVEPSFQSAIRLQIVGKVFLRAPDHGDHALHWNTISRNVQVITWRPRRTRGVSSQRNRAVSHRAQTEDLPKAAILDSIVRLAMGLQVERVAAGDVVAMKILYQSIAPYQQVRRSSKELH